MDKTVHNLPQVTSICTKQKLADLDYGQTFRFSGNPTIQQKVSLPDPLWDENEPGEPWKDKNPTKRRNLRTAYIAVGGGAVYYESSSTLVEVVDKDKVYVGVKE